MEGIKILALVWKLLAPSAEVKKAPTMKLTEVYKKFSEPIIGPPQPPAPATTHKNLHFQLFDSTEDDIGEDIYTM